MSSSVADTVAPVVEQGGSSSRRRDHLLSIEAAVQALWAEHKVFETDAPLFPVDFAKEPVGEFEGGKEDAKFFVTFPYPYMNGRLHLGHAFTVTKAEFAARFQSLLGKKVLWPFAFHCTGMPILACADKLKREIAAREAADTKAEEAVEQLPAVQPTDSETVVVEKEVGKFSGKKSKAVAKTGNVKTQWEIMQSLDIPDDEIPRFQDAQYWLDYFPGHCRNDLKSFGLAVDWRRSFITTDRNPYYDAFIRWQFNTLKKRGRINFGMRPAVFSRPDGQPCADHDRAAGEGVGPQEYTLIKVRVERLPAAILERCPELVERSIFLVAATLRPETMYGQTNVFLLPEGQYGFFPAFERPVTEVSSLGILQKELNSAEEILRTCKDVYICSARSADNMGYQGILPVLAGPSSRGYPAPLCLLEVRGEELMGLPLSAPYAQHAQVFTLPLFTISMDKGTGVVTSVPSDAPDDYAALRDLQDKAALREKFGLSAEMVDKAVVEIIEIPGYGRQAAVEVCKLKKIRSQNDRALLAEAKEELYKKGFYEGVMVVGPYAGQKVCNAKPLVRKDMIAEGLACGYYEPEKLVLSRAGDRCVVALCNQWYLDYGEPNWTAAVERYVSDADSFSAYSQRAQAQFRHVVGWLQEWACSRTYGLGTRLPWDSQTLIESLSDSTIYMAYYTIAHFLQADLDGSKKGLLGLAPADLTDELFDYVFMQTDEVPSTGVPLELLNRMRNEFSYWYPMDLRVSGKDLIFNHLTMALFNHAAMWPDAPRTKWPRSYFCNGHVMVNAEKMSKNAGNFLTLSDAIKEYSSDATRIGLADAGDSLDDANFQKLTATSALMKLFLLEQFASEFTTSMSLRKGEKQWADKTFEERIKSLAQEARGAYTRMIFRDALKASFFDFLTARDSYKNVCGAELMHEESVRLWVRTIAVILSPIAPHVCEHIWRNLLKEEGFVVRAAWPAFDAPDQQLINELECLETAMESFRKGYETQMANAKKSAAKAKQAEPAPFEKAVIYVAKDYLPWQQSVLRVLHELELDETGRAPKDANFMSFVKDHAELQKFDKRLMKDIMSFASFRMKNDLPLRGRAALEFRVGFDEQRVYEVNRAFMQSALGLRDIEIRSNTDGKAAGDSSARVDNAQPAAPTISFF